MYPQLTQFETRQLQVESELQLIRERKRAGAVRTPRRLVHRAPVRRRLAFLTSR